MKPKKSNEVPVTQEMLYAVRNELSAKIAGQSARTKSLSDEVKTFRSEMRGEFARVDAQFADLKAEIQRIGLLVEQQNANNRYVLDGYAQIYDRQDKLDDRHLKFEKALNEYILRQKDNS